MRRKFEIQVKEIEAQAAHVASKHYHLKPKLTADLAA
jgi:hypothetical protein